jgi:hypothetical protein
VQVGVDTDTLKQAFTVKDRGRLHGIINERVKVRDPARGLIEGLGYIKQTLRARFGSAPAQAQTGGRRGAARVRAQNQEGTRDR